MRTCPGEAHSYLHVYTPVFIHITFGESRREDTQWDKEIALI